MWNLCVLRAFVRGKIYFSQRHEEEKASTRFQDSGVLSTAGKKTEKMTILLIIPIVAVIIFRYTWILVCFAGIVDGGPVFQ